MAKSRPRKAIAKTSRSKRSRSVSRSLSPRDARAAAAAALRRVYSATQRQAGDGLRNWIEETLPPMLEQMDAEYRDETGQPMPRGVDQMPVAARMAGFTAGEAETGDYTLSQVHRQAIAAKKVAEIEAANRRELAAEIAKEMAAIDPNLAIDQSERILSQISIEAKKTLVALRELAALSRDQPAVRREVADLAGLSADQLRRVLEKELPKVGVDLFESITGCRGGIWLTHEGAIVADKIDAKILPPRKSSPPKNSIRRIVRA